MNSQDNAAELPVEPEEPGSRSTPGSDASGVFTSYRDEIEQAFEVVFPLLHPTRSGRGDASLGGASIIDYWD